MLFNLQPQSIYRFANIPEDLAAIRNPDLTSIFRQTVQPVRVLLNRQRGGKNKNRADVLCISEHLDQKWEKKPSCSESSWLQRRPNNTDTHTRMMNYVWQRRHFLVQGEAWEEGRQGHGNCRTPEGRCAELGRDAESRGLKPKLKQTQQGHRGGGAQGHKAGPTSFTWVSEFY